MGAGALVSRLNVAPRARSCLSPGRMAERIVGPARPARGIRIAVAEASGRMPRSDIVVGLDVGTTKISVVVAREAPGGKTEVLGAGMEPSAGMKRGVVVDLQDATAAIEAALAKAARMSGRALREAYVGVTGDHVSSLNVQGRTAVASGSEVTEEDCERALQAARDAVGVVGSNREIIHVIPRQYSLDGQSGIARPVHMTGLRLEVDAHVVTGMSSILENVQKCVERAGVEVVERVLEPVATSMAVVTEAEREVGVMLVDIGGGTTDLAVFMDGGICHTSAIPVAGDHVTRDIAIGLRISTGEAEAIKRRAGHSLASAIGPKERIPVRTVGGETVEHVPRRQLGDIIQPRLEEIFSLVRDDAKRSGVYEFIGGAVITGGGSLLPGVTELASPILDNMRVRIGEPMGLTGLSTHVATPIWSTAVGLAMYGLEAEGERRRVWRTPTRPPRERQWWRRLLEFLRGGEGP